MRRYIIYVYLLLSVLVVNSFMLTPAVAQLHAAPVRTRQLPPVQLPMINLNAGIFQDRIVGGTVAAANEFQWQALLYITTSEGTFMCGGSLVTRRYVLTAAHCMTDDNGDAYDASAVRVYLGMHDRRAQTSRSQLRMVETLTVHPRYDENTYDFDIAVLKLQTFATITPYVRTIPLARASNSALYAAGNDVTVSGWGTTAFRGNPSQLLRKTTVDIVSRNTCNRANSYDGSITGRMVCAARAGKDSCQGDSGGPLFLRQHGVFKQVGIVSFGTGCADPRYPGVYTHVGVLYTWIASKVPGLP